MATELIVKLKTATDEKTAYESLILDHAEQIQGVKDFAGSYKAIGCGYKNRFFISNNCFFSL